MTVQLGAGRQRRRPATTIPRQRANKMKRAPYQNTTTPSSSWACPRPQDTARVARLLTDTVRDNVWLLRGPLGSGKTTFVRGLLRGLGYRGVVTSPTFVLTRTYLLPPNKRWGVVLHIDAYRLRDRHEGAALDIASAAMNPRCLVVIEWPERLQEHPWSSSHTLRFRHIKNGRQISLRTK